MVATDPDNTSGSKKRERRRHLRTKVAVEVELHLEGARAPLRVKTADLSLRGFYTEMMFTLEVGTRLKIVLWIVGVKLSTGGVVVTRHLQVGNGIEFTDMAPEDRLKLKRFLDAYSPP